MKKLIGMSRTRGIACTASGPLLFIELAGVQGQVLGYYTPLSVIVIVNSKRIASCSCDKYGSLNHELRKSAVVGGTR
jgi:hypothetical protein